MTRAYRRGRTLVTAVFAYSTVIFSSLFGIWLWGEVLPLVAWAGVALIIGSGLVATLHAQETRGNAA
jgi:S-adenosylmethionine uptake transporter